jgi:hypothetical protein
VPVVIARDPFPGDSADAAAIAAMQHRNPGPPITFASAGVPASAPAPYRIIVAFGAPPVSGCAAPAASTLRMAPDRTDVSAVFCLGNRVLSEATVSGPHVQGPDDPQLARLMQDLLSALMPASDPASQNGSGGAGSGM